MSMRKVCPCSGCGQTHMCVSHDTFKFYCNRCLPHYIRRTWDWVRENPEPSTEQESNSKNKSPSKPIKSKK